MFVQALLIALITWMAGGCVILFLNWSIYPCAPLIGGFVVGLILGDVTYGMQIGAMIQLVYMGHMVIGGVISADFALAGYLAVAMTMLTHSSPEVGVTIAVSLGFLGLLARNGRMTINSIWVHRADKCAEKGDTKGIILNNVVFSQIVTFFAYAVPVFLAVYFGVDYLEALLNALPEFVLKGLQAVGSLLPALGLALLIKAIYKKSILPFFFIGFVLSKYLGLDIIGVTILGASCAAIYWFYGKEKVEVE